MAQVHPYKFTTTILSLALQSGSQLISGRCISVNSTAVTYINSEGGTSELPADLIIVAAGPWTPSLIPRLQISTFRAHSIVIDPSSLLPAQSVFFTYETESQTHLRPEVYSRPSSVYLSGVSDSGSCLPEYARDVVAVKEMTSILESVATGISTQLAAGRVVTRQACYLPISDREVPVMEWYNTPKQGSAGIYVATGHGEWGISLAPGTGKIVADVVMRGVAQGGTGWDISNLPSS
jgi:glycine/D-amino acid oxidase-like deaminating enzyme